MQKQIIKMAIKRKRRKKMSKHHDDDEKETNNERWLLTYSDMITLLLVLFIVMYTISTVNAQKFKSLSVQMGEAFGGKTVMNQIGMPPENTRVPSTIASSTPSSSSTSASDGADSDRKKQFEIIYNIIKENLSKMGYQDKIDVQRGDLYILIRFKDSVLFYSDNYTMKDEGLTILKYIGQTLITINPLIDKIQIEGHTANVGETISNVFEWQLSANRAIAVLKYFIQEDGLPQSKMSIAGYSHYIPIATNDNESGRSQNRRVEVRITQVQNVPSDISNTSSNNTITSTSSKLQNPPN
jgi:chemotaxis protein MotB